MIWPKAEAVYANLLALDPAGINRGISRARKRWIDKAEHDVVTLRERVAKLEVAE